MLLGNGFLPMFSTGASKQTWDFSTGMPSGASILRSGGNATYFDAAGIMQIAGGSDTARRNYNPATLAFEGLYVEPAATNLITYSEQINDASWSKTAATVTANSAGAPTGATTADTLTATAGSSSGHTAYKTIGSGPTSLAASCHLKQGAARYCSLLAQGSASNYWIAVTVDLQSGTVTQTGQSNGTITSSVIVPCGDGWYRVQLVGTLGQALNFCTVQPVNSGTPTYGNYGQVTWTAAGTESIYVWGAQLQSGALSSYIPTVATTATRNAESLVLTGVGATTLRATFDDDSTQDIGVTPGTVTILASALNRSLVRKVEEI